MPRLAPPDAVAGLLLAAGEGRRMGRPKALVELGGHTLVERAVAVLGQADCEPCVVVLGAQGEAVAAVLGGRVATVHNADWASGMGSSVRAGLAALATVDADAAVVALVDTPGIGPDVVRRLIDHHRRTGAVAVVATFDGAPRNPVLLHRSVWPAVAADATGDHGARGWLRANPDLVARVPCEDVGRADDLDTPGDLAAWVARPTSSLDAGSPKA